MSWNFSREGETEVALAAFDQIFDATVDRLEAMKAAIVALDAFRLHADSRWVIGDCDFSPVRTHGQDVL